MATEDNLKFADSRTEEVQHIIERMPKRFGFWISMIVVLLFVFMLIFGWVVRYPDVVNGQITINANTAPLKLIASANGKLKLNNVKSLDDVQEGEVIAYVENATEPRAVAVVDSLLHLFDPNRDDIMRIKSLLPAQVSLGELNAKYYGFANALQEYTNYKKDRLYEQQGENLILLLAEQRNAIATATNRVEMAKKNLQYVHKFYSRDSLLFTKRVISESELDKTEMNYLSGKDGLQNAYNNLTNAKQAAQQTQSKIQDLDIQKPEKERELHIALVSAYNDLTANIESWRQKYVFKAPFDGKVQFLKFYTNNQFVQAGEQVFTIVPNEQEAIGQVVLPAQGSGKIKTGQEVIVKLDNYPYMEYGSITGRIKSVSLTASTTKTEKSEIDTYLVLVDFPNQLKTNYGTKLDFKAEAKGTAEIITNDRRLVQRLFDNLKYVMNK